MMINVLYHKKLKKSSCFSIFSSFSSSKSPNLYSVQIFIASKVLIALSIDITPLFFNTSKNYTKIRIEWLEANKDKFKGDDFDLFEGMDVIPNTGDEIYLHKLEDLFYNNVQKAL